MGKPDYKRIFSDPKLIAEAQVIAAEIVKRAQAATKARIDEFDKQRHMNYDYDNNFHLPSKAEVWGMRILGGLATCLVVALIVLAFAV